MFNKGEMVVCGSNGVCLIQKISKMDGMDNDMLYYIMQPVYEKRSTVYIPVDNHKTPIRKIFTKEEANDFIKSIPDIKPLEIDNEKQREQLYKSCIAPAQCEGWVSLIKTLNNRNEERIAAGKKIISLDERYMKTVKNCLYGELAISLGISKDEVEGYINKLLEG